MVAVVAVERGPMDRLSHKHKDLRAVDPQHLRPPVELAQPTQVVEAEVQHDRQSGHGQGEPEGPATLRFVGGPDTGIDK